MIFRHQVRYHFLVEKMVSFYLGLIWTVVYIIVDRKRPVTLDGVYIAFLSEHFHKRAGLQHEFCEGRLHNELIIFVCLLFLLHLGHKTFISLLYLLPLLDLNREILVVLFDEIQ